MQRLKCKLRLLGITTGLFFALGGIIFAQGVAQQENPSAKETVEVNPEAVAKTMPHYKLDLKQLMDEAQRNIKKVDKQLGEAETFARNQAKELEARDHFEKGNSLYQEGKLREARQEWEAAAKITKEPEMKGYVAQAEKKAREEERAQAGAARQDKLAKEKQEKEEKARLAVQQKEEERAARQQNRQEELARRQAERQEKKEQARLEKQRKEEEVAQKKQAREEERARKKQEKEERARLATQQKEEERAAPEENQEEESGGEAE